MENQRNVQLMVAGVIVAMLAFSAVIYPSLPAEIPTQWGMDGSVTSTAPRWVAVLLMPVMAVVIWGITLVARYADPRKEAYNKFEKTYWRVRLSVIAFLGVLHVLTLTQYDNPDLIMKMVLLAASGLLVLLGNEMTRIEQTWFFGIRTPWTLDDERVWKRTHRVGARWMVAVGVLNIIAVLVLPVAWLVPVLLVTLLSVVGGITLYSWRLHSKLNG